MRPLYLKPNSHRSESGRNSRFTLDPHGYSWGVMRT
jgi:hypothetical protein